MSAEARPPRQFVAGAEVREVSPEERLWHMGVSPSASAGYDILVDDGYPAEEAAEMVLALQRDGRDAETFARMLVEKRRMFREAWKP